MQKGETRPPDRQTYPDLHPSPSTRLWKRKTSLTRHTNTTTPARCHAPLSRTLALLRSTVRVPLQKDESPYPKKKLQMAKRRWNWSPSAVVPHNGASLGLHLHYLLAIVITITMAVYRFLLLERGREKGAVITTILVLPPPPTSRHFLFLVMPWKGWVHQKAVRKG